MEITHIKPKKGYGYVQSEIISSDKISRDAKLLYTYYCVTQGGNDKSWKSNETIQKELGMSKNFFFKIKKELINTGLITSKQRFDKSCEVSIYYLETSTLKSDNESTLKRDSDSTLKGDSNINIEYDHLISSITTTNETADADPEVNKFPIQENIIQIFDYLVDVNINQLSYKNAKKWRLNEQDVINISEDLENFDEYYIKLFIDDFITKHIRNLLTGTTNLNYVAYSTIHNNLK